MKVKVKPTQDPEKLAENLEKKVKAVETGEKRLEVKLDEENLDILERTPGIESLEAESFSEEGLKGRPVQEKAYARLETRRDLARAVVATIDGYDLTVLHTGKKWDLKVLRRFNPDVKHLKEDKPVEVLGIEKTLHREDEELKQVDIELTEEEVEMVCRFAQPKSDEVFQD